MAHTSAPRRTWALTRHLETVLWWRPSIWADTLNSLVPPICRASEPKNCTGHGTSHGLGFNSSVPWPRLCEWPCTCASCSSIFFSSGYNIFMRVPELRKCRWTGSCLRHGFGLRLIIKAVLKGKEIRSGIHYKDKKLRCQTISFPFSDKTFPLTEARSGGWTCSRWPP